MINKSCWVVSMVVIAIGLVGCNTPATPKVSITQRTALSTSTKAVTALSISPDGKTLAARTVTGSASEQVWETGIWDVESGERVHSLPSPPSSGIGAAFSPGGDVLALGGFTHSVSLIDPQDGHEIKALDKIESLVNPPVFSPDGKLVAASQNSYVPPSKGGNLMLWDVESGGVLYSLEGAAGDLSFLPAFSPDGKQIAAGCAGNLIILWDTETGKTLRTINGPTASVRSVAYSPDGKHIASSLVDGDVAIWDAASGEHQQTLDAREGSYATAIAYAPDGSLLAAVTYSGQVLVWDAASGARVAAFDAHVGFKEDNPPSIAFSSDGKLLAAAGGDGLIVLWDVQQE